MLHQCPSSLGSVFLDQTISNREHTDNQQERNERSEGGRCTSDEAISICGSSGEHRQGRTEQTYGTEFEFLHFFFLLRPTLGRRTSFQDFLFIVNTLFLYIAGHQVKAAQLRTGRASFLRPPSAEMRISKRRLNRLAASNVNFPSTLNLHPRVGRFQPSELARRGLVRYRRTSDRAPVFILRRFSVCRIRVFQFAF